MSETTTKPKPAESFLKLLELVKKGAAVDNNEAARELEKLTESVAVPIELQLKLTQVLLMFTREKDRRARMYGDTITALEELFDSAIAPPPKPKGAPKAKPVLTLVDNSQ